MGRPSVIQIGDRHGRLVVRAIQSMGKGRHAIAECDCDCGNTSKVSSAHLRKMKSCGCSQHDPEFRRDRSRDSYPSLRPGVAMMNNLYSSCRAAARRRGLAFELTIEEFSDIVSQDCAYCGAPPLERMAKRSCGAPMYRGAAIANGVDRRDNSIGYTKANSTPCCADCNLAKLTKTDKDFIDHCRRVVAHADKISAH